MFYNAKLYAKLFLQSKAQVYNCLSCVLFYCTVRKNCNWTELTPVKEKQLKLKLHVSARFSNTLTLADIMCTLVNISYFQSEFSSAPGPDFPTATKASALLWISRLLSPTELYVEFGFTEQRILPKAGSVTVACSLRTLNIYTDTGAAQLMAQYS